jgi:hypothetical protein
MPILPPEIIEVTRPFAQVFSGRIWDWVQVLVAGAILAPGKRTVTCEIDWYGGKRRIIETATGGAPGRWWANRNQ